MITRRKAIIIITGSCTDYVFPILQNHEALVAIDTANQIATTWSRNKTPIVNEKTFFKVCRNFEGNVEVFDTDEYNITRATTQKEISAMITRFCYNVQIEPGEFKQKNTANNSAEGCIFCGIVNDKPTTYMHNMDCKLVDMIIYESENFVVVPGLGPLAPGYLMIMTKEHYLSLAQIPDYLMDEYLQVERDIAKIVETMYKKKVVFFEHGTGPNGAVGLKSIVHMHIHVMVDNELNAEYRKMFSMKPISNISQARDYSYFYYKNGVEGKQWIVTDPEVYIQRQVHRQIYAEEHNLAKDQFNWRITAFDDVTTTNVWQLYSFLKDVKDSRIKARTAQFVAAATKRFESEE